MPAENRAGRDDGRQFPERLAPQGIAFDGEQTPLLVRQEEAFPT